MYVDYKIHKSKYLDMYVFPYDLFTTSVECWLFQDKSITFYF